MKTGKLLLVPALMAVLVTTGCATKKYVQAQDQVVTTRVEGVEAQVEQAQTKLNQHGTRLDQQEQQTAELSKTAQEALQRAIDAGKLAEGRFLAETVLTDDQVRFPTNKHKLSPKAEEALAQVAAQLKTENKSVYIEIQGHTDSTGSDSHNEDLGQARAEAVRLYLNKEHGFPLHRMNVISYGESAPVDNNKTRDGRSHNRRVALVVLN
jgi:peptidoglycan-associated lipoprotein